MEPQGKSRRVTSIDSTQEKEVWKSSNEGVSQGPILAETASKPPDYTRSNDPLCHTVGNIRQSSSATLTTMNNTRQKSPYEKSQTSHDVHSPRSLGVVQSNDKVFQHSPNLRTHIRQPKTATSTSLACPTHTSKKCIPAIPAPKGWNGIGRFCSKKFPQATFFWSSDFGNWNGISYSILFHSRIDALTRPLKNW